MQRSKGGDHVLQFKVPANGSQRIFNNLRILLQSTLTRRRNSWSVHFFTFLSEVSNWYNMPEEKETDEQVALLELFQLMYIKIIIDVYISRKSSWKKGNRKMWNRRK